MDVKELGDTQAYPITELQGSAGDYAMATVGGITLRQHFAGLAMQGMLASDVHATVKDFTAQAVVIADALLAELALEPTT